MASQARFNARVNRKSSGIGLRGDGEDAVGPVVGSVSLAKWQSLVALLRPKLRTEDVELLFFSVDVDHRGHCDFSQFVNLCSLLDVVVHRADRHAIERRGGRLGATIRRFIRWRYVEESKYY